MATGHIFLTYLPWSDLATLLKATPLFRPRLAEGSKLQNNEKNQKMQKKFVALPDETI